jgi:hypothetical protein
MMQLLPTRFQLWFYVFSLILISGCQAIASPASNVGSTALALLLFAMVAGVNITSLTYVQVAVKHKFIGIATGITTCSRSLGGAIGQVIYTTIFSNKLTSNLTLDIAIPLIKARVAPASLPVFWKLFSQATLPARLLLL